MQLLDPLPGQREIPLGCLLRLLDERVNDDNALPEREAVKAPADTRAATWPQLEQAFAQRARVRQTKVWPVLRRELDKSGVVSEHVDRPRLNLPTRENESTRSGTACAMLANALTRYKTPVVMRGQSSVAHSGPLVTVLGAVVGVHGGLGFA